MARFQLSPVFLLAAMLISISSVTAKPSQACRKAYQACSFTFDGPNFIRTFSISGKPGKAFTPRIRGKGKNPLIGAVNANGMMAQFINDDGVVVPITRATKATPRFARHAFKTFHIKGQRGSGVGHQTFQGNQKKVATNRCVRVFFSEYQVLKTRFPFIISLNVRKTKMNDCVVFMTKA